MVELVTRCCELAQELARAVEASPRLELTAPAPTNTVCFRYRPEGWADGDGARRPQPPHPGRRRGSRATSSSRARELASGLCQRVAIVSWRTEPADVQALVDAVEEAGARLSTTSAPHS